MAKKINSTKSKRTSLPARPLFLPSSLPAGYSDWQNWYSQNPNPPTLPIVPEAQPKAQSEELDYNNVYHRQAATESGFFNPAIVKGLKKSAKGAIGMAQAMPSALQEYKKKFKKPIDVTTPENAVKFQKWVMDDLRSRPWANHPKNESDSVTVAKALAAYNYGATNLVNTLNQAKEKGIDIYSNKMEWLKELPKETSDYVGKILLGNNPEFEKQYAKVKDTYSDLYNYREGGLIKRKDGSYSKRGLWDNIRAAEKKEDGGPVYNWIPPNYPRVGARNEQGGWLDQYEEGSSIEDQKIPDTTAYEFGDKFIAYPDKTLTNYQMGTPKSTLPDGKIVDATPEIPAYAHGATVWNKRLADEQMSAAHVVGPDTSGTQVKNTYPDRMSGAENPTNYKIGDYIPVGMNYKSPAAGTYDYNKDIQPYYKMRLHAPDTRRMAYGGYVPMYGKGGFLKGLGDVGLFLADTTLSPVNQDIIGNKRYSDTGFGKTVKDISNVTGSISNSLAPMAANMIMPGAGTALSMAQGFSNNFVDQDKDRLASKTGQIGNQIGQGLGLASSVYSLANPQGFSNLLGGGGGSLAGAGDLVSSGSGMMAKHGGRIPGLRWHQLNPEVSAPAGIYAGSTNQRGISFADGGEVDITKPYLNPATVQATLARAQQPVTNTLGRVISTPASREKERREKIIAKDESKYSVEDYKKGIQEPGAGNNVLSDPIALAVAATALPGEVAGSLGLRFLGNLGDELLYSMVTGADPTGISSTGLSLASRGSLTKNFLTAYDKAGKRAFNPSPFANVISELPETFNLRNKAAKDQVASKLANIGVYPKGETIQDIATAVNDPTVTSPVVEYIRNNPELRRKLAIATRDLNRNLNLDIDISNIKTPEELTLLNDKVTDFLSSSSPIANEVRNLFTNTELQELRNELNLSRRSQDLRKTISIPNSTSPITMRRVGNFYGFESPSGSSMDFNVDPLHNIAEGFTFFGRGPSRQARMDSGNIFKVATENAPRGFCTTEGCLSSDSYPLLWSLGLEGKPYQVLSPSQYPQTSNIVRNSQDRWKDFTQLRSKDLELLDFRSPNMLGHYSPYAHVLKDKNPRTLGSLAEHIDAQNKILEVSNQTLQSQLDRGLISQQLYDANIVKWLKDPANPNAGFSIQAPKITEAELNLPLEQRQRFLPHLIPDDSNTRHPLFTRIPTSSHLTNPLLSSDPIVRDETGRGVYQYLVNPEFMINPTLSSPFSVNFTQPIPIMKKMYGMGGKVTTKESTESSKQNNVKNLQTKLKQAGFYSGQIDGIYGPNTEKAHVAYNSKFNKVDASLFPSTLVRAGLTSALPLNAGVFLSDLMGINNDITENTLKENELGELQKIVRTNLQKGKPYIEYEDYNTGTRYGDVSKGKFSLERLKTLVNKEMDPRYNLKTTLGQANIVTTPTDTFVVDQYNFNNKDLVTYKDVLKEGVSNLDPYTGMRNVGALFGSGPGQGAKVKIKTTQKPSTSGWLDFFD